MGLPLKTGFPPDITISSKYIVRFRAIDPTTGADIGGVLVSNPSIFATTGDSIALSPADFDPVVITPVEFELTGSQVRHQ